MRAAAAPGAADSSGSKLRIMPKSCVDDDDDDDDDDDEEEEGQRQRPLPRRFPPDEGALLGEGRRRFMAARGIGVVDTSEELEVNVASEGRERLVQLLRQPPLRAACE